MAAEAGALHLRALEKIQEHGPAYVATELRRLDGLLGAGGADAGSLHPQQRTRLMLRRNILAAFDAGGLEASDGLRGLDDGGDSNATEAGWDGVRGDL